MDKEERWQLIRSPKYVRDLFIKVRGTHNDFVAKIYGSRVSRLVVRERAKRILAIPEKQLMEKAINKLIDVVCRDYPQVKTRKMGTEVVLGILDYVLEDDNFWEKIVFDIVDTTVPEEKEEEVIT